MLECDWGHRDVDYEKPGLGRRLVSAGLSRARFSSLQHVDATNGGGAASEPSCASRDGTSLLAQRLRGARQDDRCARAADQHTAGKVAAAQHPDGARAAGNERCAQLRRPHQAARRAAKETERRIVCATRPRIVGDSFVWRRHRPDARQASGGLLGNGLWHAALVHQSVRERRLAAADSQFPVDAAYKRLRRQRRSQQRVRVGAHERLHGELHPIRGGHCARRCCEHPARARCVRTASPLPARTASAPCGHPAAPLPVVLAHDAQ
eukprot:1702697-Prymnesium_polylepis.1